MAVALIGLGSWILFIQWVSVLIRGPEASALLGPLLVWGAFVSAKGLLPQTLMTHLLHFFWERFCLSRRGGSKLGLAWSLGGCALLAGLVVAGLVLPSRIAGIASVTYRDIPHFLSTLLELSMAVAIASFCARVFLESRAKADQ